jgi:hypothetical protein
MAALAPVMIGWVNDARETTVRTEGRTVLMALNTTSVEHQSLNRLPSMRRNIYGAVAIPAGAESTRAKFTELMIDAGIPTRQAHFNHAAGTRVRGSVGVIYVEENGNNINIVGIQYFNTVRNRDVDGEGDGWLLVGRRTDRILGPTGPENAP